MAKKQVQKWPSHVILVRGFTWDGPDAERFVELIRQEYGITSSERLPRDSVSHMMRRALKYYTDWHTPVEEK